MNKLQKSLACSDKMLHEALTLISEESRKTLIMCYYVYNDTNVKNTSNLRNNVTAEMRRKAYGEIKRVLKKYSETKRVFTEVELQPEFLKQHCYAMLLSSIADMEVKLDYQKAKDDINSIMKKVLSEREINLICDLFGLNTGETITLKEAGDKYGISKSRTRQLKQKAVKKMRIEAYEIFHNE